MIDNALVDVTVKGASTFTKFQFERLGFFSVDPDSVNNTVSFLVECFNAYTRSFNEGYCGENKNHHRVFIFFVFNTSLLIETTGISISSIFTSLASII